VPKANPLAAVTIGNWPWLGAIHHRSGTFYLRSGDIHGLIAAPKDIHENFLEAEMDHEAELDHEYDYYDYSDSADPAGREPILAIASILGDAYLQCAISGLRFGFAATKTIVKGQIRLIDNLQSSRDSDQSREEAIRTIVDEARGCLRDVGEAASHEFRRLQSRLVALQGAARAIIAEGDPPEAYTRRWKAKP
jgi:hypothetical protein